MGFFFSFASCNNYRCKNHWSCLHFPPLPHRRLNWKEKLNYLFIEGAPSAAQGFSPVQILHKKNIISIWTTWNTQKRRTATACNLNASQPGSYPIKWSLKIHIHFLMFSHTTGLTVYHWPDKWWESLGERLSNEECELLPPSSQRRLNLMVGSLSNTSNGSRAWNEGYSLSG